MENSNPGGKKLANKKDWGNEDAVSVNNGTRSNRQGKKLRKTTYFFNPLNTLTGTNTKKSSVVAPSIVHENVASSANGQISEKRSEKLKTPVKENDHYEKVLHELQSSDDSYDGIRWKVSPRKGTTRKMNFPSSPLKNLASPSNDNKSSKFSSTVINEQINSVLVKYGSDFTNILSQTPAVKRSKSDISSSESINRTKGAFSKFHKSPTLVRAKSNGLESFKAHVPVLKSVGSEVVTPQPIEPSVSKNTLNSWIDKFDMKDSILSPLNKSNLQNLATESSSAIAAIQRSEIINGNKSNFDYENVQFSDDFSDTSSAFPSPNKVCKSKSTELEKASDMEILSEDPFSEDDEEIINLGLNSSNKEAKPKEIETGIEKTEMIQLPVSSRETKLESMQVTQEKRDAVHAKSFQNSIKKFDSLQFSSEKQKDYEIDSNDAKLSFKRDDLKRYQIKYILFKEYSINTKKRTQLILDVENDIGELGKLIVRGEYTNLDFQINDIIHIIITDPLNPRLIDDTKNLLIWNPDVLVSATTVSQQMSCPRKTVLVNRFNFPGDTSAPLLIGTIIHRIFQECFMLDNWEIENMKIVMDDEISQNILQIFCLGPDVESIRREIINQLPFLETWFNTYYKKPLGNVNLIPTNRYNQSVMFSAAGALDIEENIWSPMFGIKGMVDVTLEANLRDKSLNGKYLLPMEIKTGREHISHQAQSSLYSLLFKDRYDMDVISFLLVYTKERITKKYDISPTDLKSLINLRNRITKFLKENTRELPPLMKQSQCDRCEIQQHCMTINKLVEGGTPEESGLNKGIYEELTAHLDNNQRYKTFYSYWDDLITKEEGVIKRLKKELWKLTSHEREIETGKALSKLIIKESNDSYDKQVDFIYTFVRAIRDSPSLQNSQLVKYDKVIISDEDGHFAIAQGFIVSIRPDFIKISTRRRIINSELKLSNFDSTNNQTFQSVLHRTQANSQHKKLFRIDKDDMFHGLGLARFNILNLFINQGDFIRRNIVVDLKKPTYSKNPLPYTAESHFNIDQLKAFDKILSAKEYALILGMPGSGKTTVIAELIKYLIENKKTVLLASYTHSAVDNILLKVKDFGIDILRVGASSKIHRDIRKYVPGFGEKQIKTYEDFTKVYMNPPIVATTCLGISDVTFNLRDHFDYCIIDEASQVSMPVCLGPLRFCDKFILVGDHYQLPPLVQHPSPEVKAGLSQSLFKLLAEAHPQSTIELTYQYRMCKEIMLLSNLLVYNNRLKCGSEEVANRCLKIPNRENITKLISPDYYSSFTGDMWMNTILNEKNKVIFLNHDEVPGLERKVGQKVENLVEAEIIKQIIEGLTICGVKQSDVGVMSLYRSQLRLLSRTLANYQDLEILTADQFQGRDKECIIISLVRSNKDKVVGDLIREWRRINVAITRSKSKLILLGSKSTLSHAETISTFIKLLEDRGWVYDLATGANKIYTFSSQLPPHSQNLKSVIKSGLKLDSKIVSNSPIINDIIRDVN